MIKFSAAQLWVHDQDEALAFYTDKIGMEVKADVTLPELGDFRWLTVAPPGEDDVSIVLMAIPGTARVRRGNRRAGSQRDGQGRELGDLPDHRGLPRLLRGAEGAWASSSRRSRRSGPTGSTAASAIPRATRIRLTEPRDI